MHTPSLRWSAALALDLPLMDDTHQEFVEHLAALERAEAALPQEHANDAAAITAPTGLDAAWRVLIEHTDAHFAREDRWMRESGFAAANCHSQQHRVVLDVLRDVRAKPLAERSAVVRDGLLRQLGEWFVQHAQTMDAALALHMRRVDLDPTTGEVRQPEALPAERLTGCGSPACAG